MRSRFSRASRAALVFKMWGVWNVFELFNAAHKQTDKWGKLKRKNLELLLSWLVCMCWGFTGLQRVFWDFDSIFFLTTFWLLDSAACDSISCRQYLNSSGEMRKRSLRCHLWSANASLSPRKDEVTSRKESENLVKGKKNKKVPSSPAVHGLENWHRFCVWRPKKQRVLQSKQIATSSGWKKWQIKAFEYQEICKISAEGRCRLRV